MSFVVAAAGTGGHVFPGLAVGEALVALGVGRQEILYVGGDRIEASVYPESGFPFLRLELRGLKRSISMSNLTLPRVVTRARDAIVAAIGERGVRVVLGMGGYVTIPAGLAARRVAVPLMVAEQNAEAGLANRVASRWAVRSFASFPDTPGLNRGEWAGNPVRQPLSDFDRGTLRPAAMEHYDLDPSVPTLGVFGGSLGAGAINSAVVGCLTSWDGPPLQVVHLTGAGHLEATASQQAAVGVTWRRVGFEERMDLFYAASDLVVSRAGGGVAELTATGTPAILVPGEFGAHGHQDANAAFIAGAGAARIVPEAVLGSLGAAIADVLFDRERLEEMSAGALSIGKPKAAQTVAGAMLEAAG